MRQTAVHSIREKPQELASEMVSDSILRALAYFDIFHYPLTVDEIRQFMDLPVPAGHLQHVLETLVKNKRVYTYNDFYLLQDNLLLVHRRYQGNLRAEKLLTKAYKIGRFLQQFPFVRAVGISGSLSKNFAEQKADIDFFIITRGNRLWIARTMMHLFKKLTFLVGRQHFFCMNYYLDEEALRLQEQNIFNAIELKTLLPVSGQTLMQDFFAANDWSNHWLPSCPLRSQHLPDRRPSFLKRLIESCFNNRVGEHLDNYLFQKTSRRWQRKHERGLTNDKGLTMGLITGKHFAKSNPGAFQERVLGQYEERLKKLLAFSI